MKYLRLLCLVWISLATTSIVYADNLTPAGYWEQISDVTDMPQSIIQISQNKGTYSGQVVSGFLVNGKAPKTLCTGCPAPFNNQPILGMTIMWGFVSNDQTFNSGHILDPNKGSIYHCTLTLEDNGQTLKVRGYIGIPLIGRTQVWKRLTLEQAQILSKTAYQTLLKISS